MERKQLLGAVFDEVEHHFRLYDRERKVYLGLAAVAATSLLFSVVILWLKPGNHAAAVAGLGAAGLVTFAAARATAFFHSVSALVEDVVKRYSKLSEPEIVSSVEAMKKRSETSLFMVACAAAAVIGSVVYSYVRTHQMERVVAAANDQVAQKEIEITRLQNRADAAQRGYVTLKDNVIAHGAYVLRENRVLDVRASAERVPHKKWVAAPEYTFSLLLNSAPATLALLRHVGYTMHVPDPEGLKWEELKFESADPASGFRVTFRGARCAPFVDVTLEFAEGSKEGIAFNQCRLLGMTEPVHPAAPRAAGKGARSNDPVSGSGPAQQAPAKCDPTASRLAEIDRGLAEAESGNSANAGGNAASGEKGCDPG